LEDFIILFFTIIFIVLLKPPFLSSTVAQRAISIAKAESTWQVFDDFIGTAFEFEKNIKYVKFIITLDEPKDTKNNDTCVPTEPNAFDVLMEGSRSFKRN
jgi:hypothetical protein